MSSPQLVRPITSAPVATDGVRGLVATLRSGDDVDAVFACSRKERLFTRGGDPYLAVELRDRSGSIQARAFRNADLLAGRFERGDLVRVRGRVARFREELQVELAAVEKADLPIDRAVDFLPVAYRDLDELDGFLEHLCREVHDRQYGKLLSELMDDAQLRADWRLAPCTRSGHHAYLGGLLEHTVSVATLATDLCQQHPRLNSDLLLAAAIVHDIGKTREFSYGAEIGLTDVGRLLGHVELGLALLDEHARSILDGDKRVALWHCVLCHHGAEHAPGRRFGSVEAAALARLNALDATVKEALEHGL